MFSISIKLERVIRPAEIEYMSNDSANTSRDTVQLGAKHCPVRHPIKLAYGLTKILLRK